jgi:hypothetical protein
VTEEKGPVPKEFSKRGARVRQKKSPAPLSDHPFQPLEHSVYAGRLRLRLGRYLRVRANLYAAYDARNQSLGHFGNRTNALAAFDTLIVGSEQ